MPLMVIDLLMRTAPVGAGIEHADFAVLGGFRDRSRERLAGRGARTRVHIVADPGNLGPRRQLRVTWRGVQHEGECTETSCELAHVESPSGLSRTVDSGCMLAIAAPDSL